MSHAIRSTALLLVLLLNMAEPDFVFKPKGGVVEIGYCFAADYMVVYRSSMNGDQLLVNTSADAVVSILPEDLWDRANITDHHLLLGLLIRHLNPWDSRLYRTECWQNETLVSHRRQQLVVCSEEVESEEMIVLEDGGAEVRCNVSARALAGATVRWYYEAHPSYKAALFLDSSVSLDPLLTVLQGAVEVRDGGASLLVSNSVLQVSQQFFCTVMKGQNCLRFQNINLPESTDLRTIYASQGDRVVLKCSSKHKSQEWETPLGKINTTTKAPASREGQMYISGDTESESSSLVIPAFSDKHMGDYSCFSPALVVQYFIVLCPGVEPRGKSVVEGGDILLECDVRRSASGGGSVQWYHNREAGEASLIQNSTDKAASHPGDPGRAVTMSEDGFSLKLLGLTAEDEGIYWCVVLAGPESRQRENDTRFIEEYKEEEEEYKEEEEEYKEEEEEYDDYDNDYDLSWLEMYTCISKQEIVLTVTLKSGEDKGHVLGAVVVSGMLLVGVIAAVAVMKKRSKGCFKQGGAGTDTGTNFHRDTDMACDPSCTEMLAPNDASNVC